MVSNGELAIAGDEKGYDALNDAADSRGNIVRFRFGARKPQAGVWWRALLGGMQAIPAMRRLPYSPAKKLDQRHRPRAMRLQFTVHIGI
jgi:hypothetical protein